MSTPVNFKYTRPKHRDIPTGGTNLGTFSRVTFTAHVSPTQEIIDLVKLAFYANACRYTIPEKYFLEKIQTLQYVVLANTSTQIGNVPIGFVLITRDGNVEIELLCTKRFQNRIDIVRLWSEVDKKWGITRSRGQKYPAEYLKEYDAVTDIKDIIKTGVGVVMMCKTLQFLKSEGVKHVSLEVATPDLIPYYTRFAFKLADRYCDQTMDHKTMREAMKAIRSKSLKQLETYLSKNVHAFRTESLSWRMTLCNIGRGTEIACAWAQAYIKRGVPSNVWLKKIEIDPNPDATPHILPIKVQDGRYHVFNVPLDSEILYLKYGEKYTFRAISPFPSHPFLISTDPVGGTHMWSGYVTGTLTRGDLVFDTTRVAPRTTVYGVCNNHPNMGFEIRFSKGRCVICAQVTNLLCKVCKTQYCGTECQRYDWERFHQFKCTNFK